MAPCNQPDLPVIPPALQGLTSMENDLIALRLAFIRIRGLPPSASGGPRKLGQLALKGMVTNVPADLSKLQLALPRQLSGEGIIPVSTKYKLKYRASYKTAENVRPHKLREALEYLTSEPTLWKEAQVSIRSDWLRESEADACSRTPDDVTASQPSDAASNSSDEEDAGPGMDPLPEEETFLDDLYAQPSATRTVIRVAPGESQTPVGMLQDVHGEEKCFPSLFSGCARPPSSLSYSELTRFELTNVDRRFALHTSSMFYKLRKLQVIQLNRLGKMRIRKSKREGRQPLTAAEVRDTSTRDNLLSKNIGYRDLKTLRCSPDYDREGKREAFGMIRQVGPFQLFCTFSMAETKWGSLLRTLYSLSCGEDISEVAALALPWERKVTLVRNDPVTTARCYCNRRDLIFSTLCQCSDFIGPVTDFFWRDEFQKRGTAHTHAAFYVAGAPRFGISSDAEICSFIDERITCSVECAPPSDIQGQQHNHSKRYCLKDPDPAGERVCRFDYPRVPSFSTVLLRPLPEDIPVPESRSLTRLYKQAKALIKNLSESDLEEMSTFEFICRLHVTRDRYTRALRASICKPTIFLKRAPKERRVNAYNPRLLQLLHTNMDCQFALDVYAAANYITSYMMKTDLKMSKLLRAAYREASLGNMGLQQSVRHAGSAFIRGQEICAQQAVYGCLGLPYRYCSRDHVFIPSSRPTERTFLLKDERYLKSLPPDSTNCVHASVVDRYATRLSNPTLRGTESLCLSDFAAWYEYSSKFPTAEEDVYDDALLESDLSPSAEDVPVDVGDDVSARSARSAQPLSARQYRKRSKAKIIHFVHYKESEDPDAYFRERLLLFYPWVSKYDNPIDISQHEDEALLHGCSSFETRYREVEPAVQDNMARYIADANIDWNAVEETAEALNEADNAHLRSILQGYEQQEREANEEDDDEEIDDVDDPPNLPSVPPEYQIDPDLQPSSASQITETVPSADFVLSDAQFRREMRKLTKAQRLYVDHVMHYLKNPPPVPVVDFFTGGAGTGKTLTLRCISQFVIRTFNALMGTDAASLKVLLTAFPSSAAFNVHGVTLHSAFRIPICKALLEYKNLPAEVKCQLKDLYVFLKLNVTDEISMVGGKFLQFISYRMGENFDTKAVLGGIPTILSGDLFQLKPLFDDYCFEGARKNRVTLSNLWEDFVKMYELFEILRQQQFMPFAEALSRLRTGEHTSADLDLFKGRVIDSSHPPPDYCTFDRHIFSTRKKRDAHNDTVFQTTAGEGFTIPAHDTVLCTSITARERASFLRKVKKLPDSATGTFFTLLSVKPGIVVEITCNVDVQDGLYNGAWGTLRLIHHSSGPIPHAIWVEFSDPLIGQKVRSSYSHLYARNFAFSRLWTPVFRTSRKFQASKRIDSVVLRQQFPLRPATAGTFHHNQGLTLQTGTVDFRGPKNRRREPGRHDVGLSRFTCSDKLFILDLAADEITVDTRVHKEMDRLRSQASITLSIPPLQMSPDASNSTTIFLHNVRSLPLHFPDILADFNAQHSDLLLLTETRIPQRYNSQDLQSSDFFYVHVPTQPDSVCSSACTNVCAYVRRSASGIRLSQYASRVRDFSDIRCYQLERKEKTPIFIIHLYRSPSSSDFSGFLNDLTSLVDNLPTRDDSALPARFVCCGDFNVNLLEASPTLQQLETFMKNTGCFLLSRAPTTRHGSCLDHVWISEPNISPSAWVGESYWSDHMPVFFSIES